jgi:hypothetical protein
MGDMWTGPQADCGRYLSDQGLNIAYWQPIGYDSSAFPLSRGLNSGLPELRRQIDLHPGPFVIASWSLGSIIHSVWYQQAKAGGPQADRLSDYKGGALFGNPYRMGGDWAPKAGPGAVPDPGGAGIGGVRNNVSIPNSHSYAHRGDLYTCCPGGEVGDDIRIIFDFVLEQWEGAYIDLWEFAISVVKGSLWEWGILGAVIDAISFYGGGTKQHVNYDARQMGALNYLTGIVRSL